MHSCVVLLPSCEACRASNFGLCLKFKHVLSPAMFLRNMAWMFLSAFQRVLSHSQRKYSFKLTPQIGAHIPFLATLVPMPHPFTKFHKMRAATQLTKGPSGQRILLLCSSCSLFLSDGDYELSEHFSRGY